MDRDSVPQLLKVSFCYCETQQGIFVVFKILYDLLASFCLQRAVVLDKVTDLLLIIGKLTVTSLVAVLSFYVFTNKFSFISIPLLNYYWVPIVVSFVFIQ